MSFYQKNLWFVMINPMLPKIGLLTYLTAISSIFVSGCSILPNTASLEQHGTVISYAGNIGEPPTVVFQSGLGDGMSVWASVVQRLPPPVTTFAYDRPGYSGSASTSENRDPCTIAHELRELLRATGHHPPYILVGHSLGGIYQYAFAKLYPQEVGGILLVDATHPDHWATIQQRAENTALLLRGLRIIAFSPIMRREFDAQTECLSDLRLRDSPLIPAKLLIRGQAGLSESAEFQSLSRDLAERWPALLKGMSLSKVEGAGHYIQKDQPDIVANEIRRLINGIRTKHQNP